ncbi:MAG: hypothetical protein ACLQAH_05770 [Limisphaerales bacterium]
MHYLLHWGDQLNWMPVIFLGIASVALFLVRLITVWLLTRIYTLELLTKLQSQSESDTEVSECLGKLFSIFCGRNSVLPLFVSRLYVLAAGAFIGITVWGLISTAWWMFLLALLTWYIIHLPFRDIMLSSRVVGEIWRYYVIILSTSADVEALKKGGLTPEQEKEIKIHLGIG